MPHPCPRCHMAGRGHTVLTLSQLQAWRALALPSRHATQPERNLGTTGPHPDPGRRRPCVGRQVGWSASGRSACGSQRAPRTPVSRRPAPGTWHPVMAPILGCELLWASGGVTAQPQSCLPVSCAVWMSPRNAQEGSRPLSGRDWDRLSHELPQVIVGPPGPLTGSIRTLVLPCSGHALGLNLSGAMSVPAELRITDLRENLFSPPTQKILRGFTF